MRKTARKLSTIILALLMVLLYPIGNSNGFLTFANIGLNPNPDKANFFLEYDNIDDARRAGNDLNIKIAEEGITLLKNANSALPLAQNSKVSLFGSNAPILKMSGLGSGACQPTQDYERIKTIDGFRRAGFDVNEALYSMYETKNSDREIPVTTENYNSDIVNSYLNYSDVAIIFVSRWGAEGSDSGLGGRASVDLEPVKNELDLLEHVKSQKDGEGNALFKKIVLVLNIQSAYDCSSYQDDSRVNGIVWMGNLGAMGILALPNILSGAVNPSGHTVDIWPANFKQDPTWINHITGDGSENIHGLDPTGKEVFTPKDSTNGNNGVPIFKQIIFQEGIYQGYRWYETADTIDGYFNTDVENKDPANADDSYYNRHNGVVYPFGYGLSYTDFSWAVGVPTLADSSIIAANDADKDIKIPVTVTNTGSVKGKEVVQLYLRAPYDKTNAPIEKSEVILIATGKTKMLEPTESDTIDLSFNIRDLSSFDWNDINQNGFKGYEIEAGAYELLLRRDSHTPKSNELKVTYNVENTIKYDASTEKLNYNKGYGVNAKALFSQNDEFNCSGVGAIDANGTKVAEKDFDYVTRANWILPTTIDEQQRNWTQAAIQKMFDQIYYSATMDEATDPWYKTADDIPGYGKPADQLTATDWKQASLEEAKNRPNGKTAIQLKELIGVPFDDAKWVSFMNQLSFDEMAKVISNGFFITGDISAAGVPPVNEGDGVTQVYKGGVRGTAWCGSPIIAATFNTDLAYKQGAIIGQECELVGLTGYYGPGLNLHRTPRGGRSYEYYSQDGRLSGIIGGQVVKGIRNYGIHIYAKHYVANEQEVYRLSGGGPSVFMTEQALREVYLKPFEVAIKEGDLNGVMTAFGKIGLLTCGSNYHLTKTFLFNECGMKGINDTDYAQQNWISGNNSGNMTITGNMLARVGTLPLGSQNTLASSTSNARSSEGRYDATTNKLFVPTITVDQTSWKYHASGRNEEASHYTATVTSDDNWTVESPTQWWNIRNTCQLLMYTTANSNVMKGNNGNQVGYECTVFYNDNSTPDLIMNMSIGETIDELNSPVYDQASQRFMGWFTDKECNSPAIFPMQITGIVNFYAKIGSLDLVSQIYNLNYENAPNPTSIGYKKDTYVSLPPYNPAREGYEFTGWYLEPSCKNLATSESLVIMTDRVYYAKWQALESYSVQFIYNTDDNDSYEVITVSKGKMIDVPIYAPSRDNYVFGGWYIDEFGEHEADFTKEITRDTKFYANWIPCEELKVEPTENSGCNSSITAQSIIPFAIVVLGMFVMVLGKKSNRKKEQ